MRIKVCGLKREEDIDYVNQSMPDWVGFVFAGTKRRIDFKRAVALKLQLKPAIKTVGVFVNEEIPCIIELVNAGILDMVQLHGDEKEDYIRQLRKQLREHKREDVPIIKAVRVQSMEQILEAEKLSVEYLLLDAFREDEYGGSGMVFNHKLIPRLKKPYILAGGISIKNVKIILAELEKEDKMPCCIDVSSSVEVNGLKNKEKIDELVKWIHDV